MKLRLTLLFLSLLALGISGCSIPPLPVLPASHPASREAQPGRVHPYFSGLREDDATRVTKQLLSENRETKAVPRKTPGMSMEHSEMTMPMEHHQM